MRELYAYVWRASASQQIILIVLAIIAAVLATAPPRSSRVVRISVHQTTAGAIGRLRAMRNRSRRG